MLTPSIVDPAVARLFYDVRCEASALYLSWSEDNASALIAKWGRFSKKAEELKKRLPVLLRPLSQFWRRVHWIGIWLGESDKKNCTSDIREIVFADLPTLERKWHWWTAHGVSVKVRPAIDKILWKRTGEHLDAGRYRDALRAAFPVLTERLRQLRRALKERDGEKLVNELFGSRTGKMLSYADTDTCRGLRDLLCGLYTLNRNHVAHNDVASDGLEAASTIAILHDVLRRLDRLKTAKKRRRRTSRRSVVHAQAAGVVTGRSRDVPAPRRSREGTGAHDEQGVGGNADRAAPGAREE